MFAPNGHIIQEIRYQELKLSKSYSELLIW